MFYNFFSNIEYILIVDYKEMKIFLIEKNIIIIIVKKYDLFSYLLGFIISNFRVVTNAIKTKINSLSLYIFIINKKDHNNNDSKYKNITQHLEIYISIFKSNRPKVICANKNISIFFQQPIIYLHIYIL